MFFIGYLDKVFVIVILDVILETGSTERESRFLQKCGIEDFSQRRKTSVAATTKSMGVSCPHGSWKVLVKPS